MKGVILGGMIAGFGGLALGIILGMALFAGIGYFQSGGVNIAYDSRHTDVAHLVTVYDSSWGVELTVKHVMSGPATYASNAPLDAFTVRQSYTQSLWVWTSNGDIDVTMTIWGPGDDGKTYMLEFGRHACNSFTITVFNQTVTWPYGPQQIGYAFFLVTL